MKELFDGKRRQGMPMGRFGANPEEVAKGNRLRRQPGGALHDRIEHRSRRGFTQRVQF